MKLNATTIFGGLLLGGGLLYALSNSNTAEAPTPVRPAKVLPSLEAFVSRHRALAEQIQREGGPPADLALAQAALESGNGRSKLAWGYHNYFGITAGDKYQGSVIEMPNTQKKGPTRWRSYPDDLTGWRDWAKVARNIAQKGGLTNSTDAMVWANALDRGGYAEIGTYAPALKERIRAVRSMLGVSGPDALTPAQIATLAAEAGFKGADLVISVAVALAESNGLPWIGSRWVGLWQIDAKAHNKSPEVLRDPATNAQMAYGVWKWASKNKAFPWQPWGAFTDGRYKQYLPEAQKAVASLGVL